MHEQEEPCLNAAPPETNASAHSTEVEGGRRFEFGKNGKPLYIGGPNESPAQSRSIAERISRIGGHYIVPAEGPHGELGSLGAPDDDSFDDDFDDEDEDDVPQKRLLS